MFTTLRRSSANAACGGLKPPPEGRLRRARPSSLAQRTSKISSSLQLSFASWHNSTWNPTTAPLLTWLAGRLAVDHPGLAASDSSGATLAAGLLADERILPVLDGFDEIAAGL